MGEIEISPSPGTAGYFPAQKEMGTQHLAGLGRTLFTQFSATVDRRQTEALLPYRATWGILLRQEKCDSEDFTLHA